MQNDDQTRTATRYPCDVREDVKFAKRFWEAITRGLSSEDAAAEVGVALEFPRDLQHL